MADISNKTILDAEKALVDAEKALKDADKALEEAKSAEDVKKAEAAKKVAEDKKLETAKKVTNAKKSFEKAKKRLDDLKSAYRLFGQGDLIKFWLFEDHRLSTKWLNYFPVYEKWFSPYRGKDMVFVEVGVWKGGSIQMWKNYFGKDAKIIGIDINPDCKKFEDEQISIEIGSQDDAKFWASFKEKYPRVDILLDDGGHMMNQQIVTFREMFPHIKDGGLYMCEDCHTSYHEIFGGGEQS